MFARQLLDQVNAVFYRRQRNLKRILLEKLQSFLLKNHPDVNCGDCQCRLGHPDANIFDLSEKFALAEEGCSITQLVTSFRKSVLGFLEDEYLDAQPSDTIWFYLTTLGCTAKSSHDTLTLAFFFEFQRWNEPVQRASVYFYVALAGRWEKYFAEQQQKIQSLQKKNFTNKSTHGYTQVSITIITAVSPNVSSDLINEIAFEINQTSFESTILIKLYKFILAIIKSEPTAK